MRLNINSLDCRLPEQHPGRNQNLNSKKMSDMRTALHRYSRNGLIRRMYAYARGKYSRTRVFRNKHPQASATKHRA